MSSNQSIDEIQTTGTTKCGPTVYPTPYAQQIATFANVDEGYSKIAISMQKFDALKMADSTEPLHSNITLFNVNKTSISKEMDINVGLCGHPQNFNTMQLVEQTLQLLKKDGNVKLLIHRYTVVPSKGNNYEKSGLNMAFVDGIGHRYKIPPDVILPHFKADQTEHHSEIPNIYSWDWGGLHHFPSQRSLLHIKSPKFNTHQSICTAHMFENDDNPNCSFSK
jgi:hypothetical protein